MRFSIGVCILRLELGRNNERRQGQGKPHFRGQGRATSMPELPQDHVEDHRQVVSNIQRTLAGIFLAIDVFITNQIRLDRNNNDGGQTFMAQGTDGSARGALFKNFITLRPLEFHGGPIVSRADNWLSLVEKHLWTMGCTDAQKVQLGAFLL